MIKVSKRLLLGFLFVALVGCEQKLRDSLDEAQANDILALLRQQGLSAEKKRDSDGTWSVELQGNGKNLADQLLHSYEVPRDARKNMLDIFPGGGLMPSEGEERIRYQSGLAEELARTLEKMDGVLSARVHVAIPLKREVNDASSISAAAFIRYRSDVRLDLLKPQIKALIAASVPGARGDRVSLLMIPVYPVARTNASALINSWFGIQYRSGDRPLALTILLLPWISLVLVGAYFLGGRKIGHRCSKLFGKVFFKTGNSSGTWDSKTFTPPVKKSREKIVGKAGSSSINKPT